MPPKKASPKKASPKKAGSSGSKPSPKKPKPKVEGDKGKAKEKKDGQKPSPKAGKKGSPKLSPEKEKEKSPRRKPTDGKEKKSADGPSPKKGGKKVKKDVPEAPEEPTDLEATVPAPAISPPPSQVAAYLRSKRASRPEGHTLDVDPRTQLPFINLPPRYEQAFGPIVSASGSPILMHVFEEVGKANDRPPHTEQDRILMITDQTLMLCDRNGSMVRALQVNKISRVDSSVGGDRIAIVGPNSPDEYDIVFSLRNGPVAKGNVIKTLHQVYKRMTDGKALHVNEMPQVEVPGPYRLEKPPGYVLKCDPQRTKLHLQKVLENYDQQEEETLRWVEELQNELEAEHAENLKSKDEQIHNVLTRLEEAQAKQDEQQQEIHRLQHLQKIAAGQEDDLNTEGMDPKDKRIYELEKALVELQTKLGRRMRDEQEPRVAGNFFERDLSHEVKQDPTRPRSGSLHMQGLVEVLQDQVLSRNKELEELRDKLDELERLRTQVRHKDATITALRNQAASAGGVAVHREPPASIVTRPSDYEPSPYIPQVPDPYHPVNDGLGDENYPEDSAMLDQSYGGAPAEFKPAPFVSSLPRTADELQTHPANNLPLIDLPPEFLKPDSFHELKGVVLHMFTRVKSLKPKRPEGKDQVLVVTDTCIYLASASTVINRCIRIADIDAVHVGGDYQIGLSVRSANEFDLLLEMLTHDDREMLIHIIKAVQAGLKVPDPAAFPPQEPGTVTMSRLRLQKPRGYSLKIRPVMLKSKLFELMQKNEEVRRSQHMQLEQSRAQEHQVLREQQHQRMHMEMSDRQAAQDSYTRQAIETLKHDLRNEFQMKKDAEYQRLKQRILFLEAENDEKQSELEEMKDQWRKHRCYTDPRRPNIPTQHSEGMYWIPSEPLVLEGELEVLKMQFWDSILITSHANGFLNVWDIDTAECIRTLKEHTAKVVAFQYDGLELVSGSYDSTIRRWNVTDGSCLNVVQGHRGQVTCLQFDRNLLITGATDTTIQMWQMDIELRNIRTLRGHKAAVQCLRFEKETLVSAEWGWLFIWDITTGLVTKALRDEQGGITCLDFADQYLVTGGQAGTLNLWDIATGEYETLDGHTDDIHHIQVEGPFAVTSSADCTIRMWDLVNFKSLGIFNNSYPHEAKTFQFIANRFIAVENKTLKVWTK